MFKMFVILLLFLYVIVLVYLALKEVDGDSVGDCEGTHVIDMSTAITGYMEDELMDRILKTLSELLTETRPGKVVVGEIAREELEGGRIEGLGRVYLLYGTTSRDYGRQVMEALLQFLRNRGFASVEVRNIPDTSRRDYYYVFVGMC